jgi:hypothetical protein
MYKPTDHPIATDSMSPIETKGNWFWKDGKRVHSIHLPITTKTKTNNPSSSSKA